MELLQDLNRDYQRYRHNPRERAFLGLQGLQPVLSSNVSAVGVRDTELLIRFHNGSVYSYRGRADDYDKLLQSNSKGKWVWRNLRRKNAPYQKIGVIPLPDDIGVTDEDIFQEIDNRYLADLTRHVDVPVFQSFEFIRGINMQKIVVGNVVAYKPITDVLPLAPEQPIAVDTQQAIGVEGRNIVKEILPKKIEINPFDLPEDEYEIIFNDIRKHIETQGYNKPPQIVSKQQFKEIKKQSGITLFRGYYGEVDFQQGALNVSQARQTVEKYRIDMEQGDFFVDNSGGAMYGRGMYFAYGSNDSKRELREAYETAQFYGQKLNAGLSTKQGDELAKQGGVKIDKATLDPDTRIATLNEIQKEYEEELLNLYFEGQEKSVIKPLVDLSREKAELLKKQYDFVYNKKVKNKYTKDELKAENVKINIRKQQIDKELTTLENNLDQTLQEKYNNFNTYRDEVDDGVKATTLGYDGIIIEEKNYFVLVNRSKLVLLDDKGEYNNENFDDLDI